MYFLALAVGMRQGKLFALHWRDVHLADKYLQVRLTLKYDRKSKLLILKRPKWEKSRRRIELPQLAVDALTAHKAAMMVEGKAGCPIVFCNVAGGFLRSQNLLRRSFSPILKAAELPTTRFHDLRHTYASLQLAEGQEIYNISKVVGHSSVAFTYDTYCHLIPDKRRDSANMADRIFSAAG